ncbi:MAG: 1-deoxy-D-xylulose-5-phosphate synthase [Candidatus Nanopelagicales bacterium]
MSILDGISTPLDLKNLTREQLDQLALEIRAFLVDRVARTGGHLGPNLGVVELSIALHRVFDSPRDVILWDTGHQAYVHKILTGRGPMFDTLRQRGGLSGYPSRAESVHDVIENSHASTSLSYADGIAKALSLDGTLGGEVGRHVVAIIGDGALTGGMSWEALNNIAAADRPLIIVVNDNERSYSPTIGGLAHHLSTLRTTKGYERFLSWGRRLLKRTPMVGEPVYDALHGMKKGLKDVVAPQGLFEDLGLKYVGPIDGHDEAEVEHALRRASTFMGPVIVHVITEKGRGYAPAELDDADRFHGVGIIDPDTGRPLANKGVTWTGIFSDELCAIGARNDRIVAITAAMAGPTGLADFGEQFPDRFFDVGIAEQHAVTSAAGLAFAGRHPVVAVYATFLNRAFDQVVMDVALHKAGVTFVLDRAGVTGDDGPSHNGMWDIAMLSIVPGIHIAAPRDEDTLREALREAVAIDDAPTVVRFPKGSVAKPIPALAQRDGVDVLRLADQADVLVIAVGSMAPVGLAVADRLEAQGITVEVLDPRWLLPLNPTLVASCLAAKRVVTLEDGLRRSGMGSALRDAMAAQHSLVPVWSFGLPEEFLDQASRAELMTKHGLTAQEISRQVVEWVSADVQVTEVPQDSQPR